MEKLYYTDRYLKEFTAEVVEVKEKDGQYHVILDKTAFFPGGGGQPGDSGSIENINVIDVYEENGVVVHVLDKKPIKIHRVKCNIDWNKRFDGMQQHLGQHILSGCFYELFNANTVSFHMGKESSTVDINGFLEESQIREAEKMANEIIQSNIDVEFFTPKKNELKKLKLRRDLPKTNEEITVVKIGDLDINACCGVHPKSTLDLGVIKVKRWEKHKGATRIEFLTGNRAVKDYLKADEFMRGICKMLNCGDKDAINTISRLSNEIKSLQDANRSLKVEISEYEISEMIQNAEKFGQISIIKSVLENEDLKHISKNAEKLIENDNVVVLFAINYSDKANLIFGCSKNINNININELLKDAISLIDGRGGGSKNFAQGGGKSTNNLEATIDYAYMKIKRQLEK